MAKEKTMEEKAKAAQQMMERMNASPTMSVTEHFDNEGKLVSKDVVVTPRNASAVEFNVDSKGQVKPRVKVYHEDPYAAFAIATDLIEKALAKASDLS